MRAELLVFSSVVYLQLVHSPLELISGSALSLSLSVAFRDWVGGAIKCVMQTKHSWAFLPVRGVPVKFCGPLKHQSLRWVS